MTLLTMRPRVLRLDYPIDEAVQEVMREHARSSVPREACGLVGLRRLRIVDYVPYANTAAADDKFELAVPDGQEDWPAPRGAIGLFHSHPAGTTRPSATDVREALATSFWPGRVHVIYSVPLDEFGVWRIG